MRHLVMIAGILAFSGCSKSDDLAKQRAPERLPVAVAIANPRKDANLTDIHEAVFRHQFKKNGSAVQQKAKAYFLSINEKDPGADFLKRFDDHHPPVRAGSQFKEGEGLLFRSNNVQWIDDNSVKVDGGYFEHGKSASSNRYRVIRKTGKWDVEKDEVDSVS